MKVMGIDPGIASTGYGIVSQEKGKLEFCTSGNIRTSSKLKLEFRLKIIHSRIQEIIEQYQPNAIAIEEVFIANNFKMALNLGQALGVSRLAAAQSNIEVFTYSVLNIKQAVVGYGRAEKRQMQAMVSVLLGLSQEPSTEHEADALAAAICHLHTGGNR